VPGYLLGNWIPQVDTSDPFIFVAEQGGQGCDVAEKQYSSMIPVYYNTVGILARLLLY
jgi:hypothetical protein